MTDPIQTILSALTLLGLGGILGGYITYLLDKKREREFKVLEQKIENPVRENFLKTILSMRQDLSSKRNDLDLSNMTLAEAGQFPSKWFRAKFRISH